MKYQKSSHTTYDVRYHIVWITKYRNLFITSEISKRLEFLIRKISEKLGVVIIKIGFEEDHVHVYCRIPLIKPISSTIGYIKGSISRTIKKDFYNEIKKWYWKTGEIWAVGYFVASVGEINGDIIGKYVESQGKEENKTEEIEL